MKATLAVSLMKNRVDIDANSNLLSTMYLRPSVLMHYLISIGPVELPSPHEQLYQPLSVDSNRKPATDGSEHNTEVCNEALVDYIQSLTKVIDPNDVDKVNSNSMVHLHSILNKYPDVGENVRSSQSQNQAYAADADVCMSVIQGCLNQFISRIAIDKNKIHLRVWYEALVDISSNYMNGS